MEEKRKNSNKLIEICFHCGLPSKSNYQAVINDKEEQFCCFGCISACKLIYSSGAESYYKNRINFSEIPVQAKNIDLPYESKSFYQDYVKEELDNLSIKFYVESIHCPSCIWVIEKVLEKEFDIKSVNINYTAKTVKISWDKNKTTLKEIVETLISIGYTPQPVEIVNTEENISKNNKDLLLKMTVAGFGATSIMFLSEPFYFKYVQDLNLEASTFLKYISLIISTPVYFYCIKPFYKSIISAIKYQTFSVDSNIFIGATLIYIYSIWAVFTNNQVYFDCLTMFLFLILIGRFVESTVKENIFIKVNQSINNYPKQSVLVEKDIEKVIYTKDIKPDDIILIKSGEQISIDGEIVYGSGYINESVITGESKALYKKLNDKVISGSILIDGFLYIKTEKIGSDTTLNKIIDLSENILTTKSQINLFTDKASNLIISFSLLCAFLAFIINLDKGVNIALLSAVSVIVVTCPCAIGLAIPASISIASSMGLKKGILFKNSKSFELINKTNNIIFDKTGTITYGDMKVSDIECFNGYNKNNLIEITASVERYSEHPIAKAIVSHLNKEKLNIFKAQDFKSFIGKGVIGKLNENELIVGKRDFLIENNIQIPEQTKNSNDFKTQVFVAYNCLLVGIIYLEDQLKKDAVSVINKLKSKNIDICILSGDKNSVVKNIAELAQIELFRGEMNPESKAEYIKSINKKNTITMMVGDGINDTPAMSSADISVAITSSNDLTNLKADIVILNKDFSAINDMFDISNRTFKIIKQNIFLSFLYNLIVIPIAITGYISPLIAAILMPLSSFIVLFNSLKILRKEN